MEETLWLNSVNKKIQPWVVVAEDKPRQKPCRMTREQEIFADRNNTCRPKCLETGRIFVVYVEDVICYYSVNQGYFLIC